MATEPSSSSSSSSLLRWVLGLAANVTVVTGLLVYFGWRRAETQAERVGLEESIFDLSTREYALRSVGPVLRLLLGVAVLGLLWTLLDRPLVRWMGERRDRWTAAALAAAASAWLVLPLLVWASRAAWPDTAAVLFPASVGVGVLLLLYAERLWAARRGTTFSYRPPALFFGGLLVAVALFATASTYAEVEGVELADRTVRRLSAKPPVVVFSTKPLHLGEAEETALGGDDGYRFRYDGLRLLDRSGGRFFLVGDCWNWYRGAVVTLVDDPSSQRLEFGPPRPLDTSGCEA